MIQDVLHSSGYLGLFAISFVAATLVPVSSEVAVVAMDGMGYNHWLLLAVATTGNYLGAMTNYFVGRLGDRFVLSRFVNADLKGLGRARNRYARWGTRVLFFSWVPVIGDPLVVVAGLLNANLLAVSFWVIIGKASRYAFLLGVGSLLWRSA